MTIRADSVVTGGTGFLGRWLVAALTREGREVVVLARGGAERTPELEAFVDAHGGDASRMTLVHADLAAPGLGITETIEGVRDVYHLGAIFGFGLERERVRETNVAGALRVAEWARAQPGLRRLIELGGYRMTKMPDWLLDAPQPLPEPILDRLYRHYGAYEASKYEAHLALLRFVAEHGLPFTAVHPSTVIGSSVTGETSQVTGLGEIVEKLWCGQMPALAGSPETWVPLVTVDHLAAFLASVPTRLETVGRELTVLDRRTPKLPELVAAIGATLGVAVPARLVSVGLLRKLPSRLTGVERETLTFLSEDDYDTEQAEAHAAAVGLSMPDIERATERWVTHLVATDFGRSSLDAPARFHLVGGSRTFEAGDVSSADTLFLHGLPWDGESGRDLAELLPGEVARVDLPGMGRSSGAHAPREQWLAERLADRGEPIHLVAHSLSTGIALRFAAEHPDAIRSLTLVSPFFLQRRAPWYLRCAALTRRLLRTWDAATLQRRLLGTEGPTLPAVASAHRSLSRPAVAATVAGSLAQASHHAERAELRELLARCARPVQLVHGERDPLLDVPEGSFVVTIGDAGHDPHVTRPTEVASAIVDFWRSATTEAGYGSQVSTSSSGSSASRMLAK